MRRTLVFAAVAAALLASEATFNWWIDPFGSFWDPGALTAARRADCLLSEELVGNAYPQFKLDLLRRRPTRVFVIGSSRTVKIAAHPGEATFTNAGMPNATPKTIAEFFRDVPASAPPQTVYLGIEPFWFNPAFKGGPSLGWYADAKYLVSASAFRQSLRLVRRAPWELTRRWRLGRIASHCVIGRTDVGIEWRLDGSRLYGYELAPSLYHPLAIPFTTDLSRFDLGYYDGFTSLSKPALHQLELALDTAHRRHWRVVGFTLPNPTRDVQFLRANPVVGPRWREFERVIPQLLRSRGFAWLNLSDVRSVPCAQNAFADGGFHPNGACSSAIRRRLDAVSGSGRNSR